MRRGSGYLRSLLIKAAHGASRSNDRQLATFRSTLTASRDYKRSIVATAHKIARAIYVMVRDRIPYRVIPAPTTTRCSPTATPPAGCASSHSSTVAKTGETAPSASTGKLRSPHRTRPDPFTGPDQDRTRQPSIVAGEKSGPSPRPAAEKKQIALDAATREMCPLRAHVT